MPIDKSPKTGPQMDLFSIPEPPHPAGPGSTRSTPGALVTSAPPKTSSPPELADFDDNDPFALPLNVPAPKIRPAAPKARIYSVAEISTQIRDTLQERFQQIMIQGEIADFKGIHRSGHLYCGLKDETAQIRMVMWKGALQKVPFDVKGGLEVIITGKVDYYPGSGSLQIVAEKMEPVGIGALQLKFEQLRAKLQSEGLFEPHRKRKIPAVNWRIGIATGKSTAAFQDMLKIFRTRFPLAEIFLFHCSVQGEKAPSEVIEAIRLANRYSEASAKPLDVLIVGRGGGSYEDLFCFNDEGIARAIVASKLPVVSAVGHEIDFTIADMVADRRAATPTHAAQELVPDRTLWIDRLAEIRAQICRRLANRFSDYRLKIDTWMSRIVSHAPDKKIQAQKDILHQFAQRIPLLMQIQVDRRKTSLQRYAGLLDALSPLKVMNRGYSMVTTEDGRVIKSVRDAEAGQKVAIGLKDGNLKALIQ